jgi:Na+/melibiose symporter-like transporter
VGVLPAIASIYFYAQYRIDQKKHTEIQRALIERRKQNVVVPSSEVSARLVEVEPSTP